MLTNFVLGIVPPILDMFFSIFQEIVITSFTVLVDVVKTVVTQIFEVVKMLIKSGMLTTIMNVGMDFLIIMVTEILLPLLFAAIDTLMCILDLFAPSGWNEQLEYATKKSNPPRTPPIAATKNPIPSKRFAFHAFPCFAGASRTRASRGPASLPT